MLGSKRAYITPPPQDSAQNGAILLSGVAMNKWILSLIDGALATLKETWNFQQIDTEAMTPEEASQYFENMQEEFIVSICDAIADCLNDESSPANTAMKNQIAKQMNQGADSDPNTPTYSGSDSGFGKEKDATLTHDNCDNDIMFGFATQLVDLINSTIEDAFQIVEAGSNVDEKAAILVQEVPMLGEALAYADQIVEEVVENYSAYYTEEIRDKFRCDIWCMIVQSPDCTFKFSQLASYFYGLAGMTPSAIAFNETMEILTNGLSWGATTVYFAHALLCDALQYASSFSGLSVPQLQKVVQSYFNDADSDWSTICDDCVNDCPPSGDFNFVTGQCFEIGNVDGGIHPTANGQWIDGTGFVSVQTGGGSATIEIYYEIPQGTLTSLSMTANRQGNQNEYTQAYVRHADGSSERVINGDLDSGNTSWTGSIANATAVSFIVYGGNNGEQEYRITGAHIGVA